MANFFLDNANTKLTTSLVGTTTSTNKDTLRQVSIAGSFINGNTIACLTFSNISLGLYTNSQPYLYIGYSTTATDGFAVYTNKNCKSETEKKSNVIVDVTIKNTVMKFKKYDLSNKINGINDLYIKNTGSTDIDNFYILIVCKNTVILKSEMSSACYRPGTDDGKKIITNGNNPILSWKFTLKTTEGYGVKTAQIFLDRDSSTSKIAYLGLSKNVNYYVNNKKPLYVSHPNINMLYGIENTSVNNTEFAVYVQDPSTPEDGYVKTKVTVIPKILTVNLVELTFEVTGTNGNSRGSLQQGENALLTIKEHFDTSSGDTFDKQYVFSHLYNIPYTQFFWKKTNTIYSDTGALEILNFDYYDNFTFNIVQESKNYYVIKELETMKFNYFYHVVQPKTWNNIINNIDETDKETFKESTRDFYMYYAQFATCYCDKDGTWYLYFNPGGYLVSNEITIGLSVMSLTGEHITLEQVTLTKEVDDSTLVYKETKTLDTYVEYGNVDTYVTLYDNFTDSVESITYDIDDNEVRIANIAEDVLKYDNTKLYIDDETHTGVMIYKDNLTSDNVFEAHDGDLAYTAPILYNSTTRKYSIVLYSKQFSQLFDRNITKDDIKEISIIGPINYNLTNQVTDRSFDYVQLNYETPDNSIIIGQTEEVNNVTTSNSLFKKIYAQKYNEETLKWEFISDYIYICGFYRASETTHIMKIFNSHVTYGGGSVNIDDLQIHRASMVKIYQSNGTWAAIGYTGLNTITEDFKVITVHFNTSKPPVLCANSSYNNTPYKDKALYLQFKHGSSYVIYKYDISDIEYFDEK